MRRLTTLFAMLAIIATMTSTVSAQRNEVEVRPFFSIDNEKVSVYGADLFYRRNLGKRISLLAGVGRGIDKTNNDLQFNTFAVGGSIALWSTRKGFYLDLAKIYETSRPNEGDLRVLQGGELGLGYKLPLSRKVFVNARVSRRWGSTKQTGGHLGVGMRF